MKLNDPTKTIGEKQLRERAAAFVADLEQFMDRNHDILESSPPDETEVSQDMWEEQYLRL